MSHMQPCMDCGVLVETSEQYRAGPRRCTACATEIRKHRDRLRHKLTYEPTSIVRVTNISDRVRDAEERFYLRGYLGSQFKWWDFRESLKAGVFNGLTITKNGKQYEIDNGRLIAQRG